MKKVPNMTTLVFVSIYMHINSFLLKSIQTFDVKP